MRLNETDRNDPTSKPLLNKRQQICDVVAEDDVVAIEAILEDLNLSLVESNLGIATRTVKQTAINCKPMRTAQIRR